MMLCREHQDQGGKLSPKRGQGAEDGQTVPGPPKVTETVTELPFRVSRGARASDTPQRPGEQKRRDGQPR